MIKIVLDSSFLVAAFDAKDKWHPIARSISKDLQQSDLDLIHLDLILGETISVLGRRLDEQKRSAEFDDIISEIRSKIPINKITWASMNIWRWYDEILALITQYNGKLNFNDALIAIKMQKSSIRNLISFDEDFDQLSWIVRLYNAQQVKAL